MFFATWDKAWTYAQCNFSQRLWKRLHMVNTFHPRLGWGWVITYRPAK
jgi:hypothetical protein